MVTSGGLPASARLPAGLREELVAWARAGVPNEACGILAGERSAYAGGLPLAFHPLANAAASPFFYRIDPAEQLRIMLALDDAGQEVWGIFHSHVRSAARPSPTDVRLAFYPDALYLLCSLQDPDLPDVRAWSICDGVVTEVRLETS
ncbi:MAG: Mov34/MPN/PAD-1 family protein [Candidatus Limnocylindrales bacterium]